jgi:hypothetical protein
VEIDRVGDGMAPARALIRSRQGVIASGTKDDARLLKVTE